MGNTGHWHDSMMKLTPVERVGDWHLKREDKFAPHPTVGINGAKLRQLIWLVNNAKQAGYTGVVGGAVSGSPQHPMMAAVAAHYGMEAVSISGAKDVEKYPMLGAARALGAHVMVAPCAYAKSLESEAYKYAIKRRHYWVLETNITLDLRKHPAEHIARFHAVGAAQVRNVPDDVETLVIPSGSCNSVTSVLYGIHKYRPKNLRRVVMMGIGAMGSSNPAGVFKRLEVIGQALGKSVCRTFRSRLVSSFVCDGDVEVLHVDVNKGCGACTACVGGFTKYEKLMPYTCNGVIMHPRYEGKVWSYMDSHPAMMVKLMGSGPRLFWVVGGPL